MDEYRLLNKKFKKEPQQDPFKKRIYMMINKILICSVLFLVALIATKHKVYKDNIYKYVYSYNFSFSEIENLYKKYFGSILPTTDNNNPKKQTEQVSSEKLSYENLEEIENGVKLKVGKEYALPAIESGLVIFAGEKENLGTTLILEQIDGVEVWYIGVDFHDLKLYDYVEKSTLIASSKEEYISIYFKRRGESIDYKNYLS